MRWLRRVWERHWNLAYRLRQLQAEVGVLLSERDDLRQWLAVAYGETMPDYTDAVWMPSPHLLQGRGGVLPKWIVLHARATSLAAYAATLDAAGESYHYLLGEEATLQLVSEEHTAHVRLGDRHDPVWDREIQHYHHNPGYFTYHIGLALDREPPLPELRAALYRLLDDLLTRHRLPREFQSLNGGVMLADSWGEPWPDLWPLDELRRAVESGTWDLAALEPSTEETPAPDTGRPRRKKKEAV